MTPQERDVIECAKAWQPAIQPFVDSGGSPAPAVRRLLHAVHALIESEKPKARDFVPRFLDLPGMHGAVIDNISGKSVVRDVARVFNELNERLLALEKP